MDKITVRTGFGKSHETAPTQYDIYLTEDEQDLLDLSMTKAFWDCAGATIPRMASTKSTRRRGLQAIGMNIQTPRVAKGNRTAGGSAAAIAGDFGTGCN